MSHEARVYHKFHARPTEFEGHRYASKKEAQYAQELGLRKRAGEVLFWLEQVLFRLPGSTIHRVDFMEFWTDGTVHFVEVKGFDTPMGKMKRKMVEAEYPIEIEVV